MPISLARAGADAPRDPARIRAAIAAYAQKVLAREGVRRADVTIVLADDALLRTLNQRWRKIDRATDVLSFTYRDTGEGEERGPAAAARVRARSLEGELYVSLARVEAQAKRFRHGPGDEMARLVTHGLLHLCGHDHMEAGERRVMRAAETVALERDLGAAARTAFERVARPGDAQPAAQRPQARSRRR
jgi:probable rRNA maturation factor